MPSSLRSLNLIQTKTNVSKELEMFETWVSRVSMGALILLMVSGILVGSLFFFLRSTESRMTEQKSVLVAQVSASTVKEGLLLAIKRRSTIVDTLIGKQKSFQDFFTTITRIVPTNNLNSLSFDERGKTVMVVHTETISEVLTIVDVLLKETKDQKIKNPELISLTFGQTGGIQASFSFIGNL